MPTFLIVIAVIFLAFIIAPKRTTIFFVIIGAGFLWIGSVLFGFLAHLEDAWNARKRRKKKTDA